MMIRFLILLALHLCFWIMLFRALRYGRRAMRRMLQMEEARALAIVDLLQRQASIETAITDKIDASAKTLSKHQAVIATTLAAKVEASAVQVAKRLDGIDQQIVENTELTRRGGESNGH